MQSSLVNMNKNTFCAYPFDTIFLGPDAGIKTCCSSRGDIGNLDKDNIETILQGKVAQDIRDSIINGKWHPQCSQCKELEEFGGRSERSVSVEKNYDIYNSLNLDKTYFNLKKIDLRWSNTCNLACNYCYEYFSSKWANIKGIKVNTLNELNEESLLLYIDKNKAGIETVDLLGGEPLLQKQNLRLAEMLPDKKYYMLTNLATPVQSNRIAEKLLDIEDMSWGISFENIGDRFEYVRHGAKWNQFLNNIEYIKTRRPNLITNAHPLYCTYSAFNLVEYYDYVLSENIFQGIYWCIIQNIDGLNVLNLSSKLKEIAINEIEKCETRFKNETGIDHLIDIKQKLIDSVDQNQNKSFINWTKQIEQQQGKTTTFKQLWPELYQNLI